MSKSDYYDFKVKWFSYGDDFDGWVDTEISSIAPNWSEYGSYTPEEIEEVGECPRCKNKQWSSAGCSFDEDYFPHVLDKLTIKRIEKLGHDLVSISLYECSKCEYTGVSVITKEESQVL